MPDQISHAAQAAINTVLARTPDALQPRSDRPEPHWRDLTQPADDAAPYDAGDAPTTARPLPTHDDLQQARTGRPMPHLDAVKAERDEALQARDVLAAQDLADELERTEHERDLLVDAISRMISMPPRDIAKAYSVRYGPLGTTGPATAEG